MSGVISYDPQDWSVFGSVLGGAFTLVGGLATLFTLLFLYDQQRKNAEVLQKQLSSLTFEQYIQHLSHFKTFMESVGKRNRIVFSDLDRLYQVVFPGNRPAMCTFEIDYQSDRRSPAGKVRQLLGDCTRHIIQHSEQTESANAIRSAYELKTYLGMGFESSFAGNGLVKIDNSKSGLLIDRLEVQIKAIENVVNELLFFGGSDRMSFADVVTDWAGPTRTLVLLAANSQSRGLKLEQPGGIIGISKLYELLRPLTIVPELKKVVEEFYAGEKLISFLQVAFVKARGESLAKTLTGLQNYSEISELPEILEVREVLVRYFDVHFRFFEPFRLR